MTMDLPTFAYLCAHTCLKLPMTPYVEILSAGLALYCFFVQFIMIFRFLMNTLFAFLQGNIIPLSRIDKREVYPYLVTVDTGSRPGEMPRVACQVGRQGKG